MCNRYALSSLRKKAWYDLKSYLEYQWTGFPPEIQERGNNLANRVRPIANGIRYKYETEGKPIAKNAIKQRLRAFPVSTPYTGKNAFQPKPKNAKPKEKFSYADLLLTKKEQAEIKKSISVPSYLEKKKEEK